MYVYVHLHTGILWVDSDRGWPCAGMYVFVRHVDMFIYGSKLTYLKLTLSF